MIKNFETYNKNNYLIFLFESRGISDICFYYRDEIMININKELNNFINSSNFINNKFDTKSTSLHFDFNDKKLKIKNFTINLEMFKYKENTTGNSVANFQYAELNDKFMSGVYLNMKIYIKKLDDDFLFKISSIILHELVHIFEFYNIKLNNKFRPKSWSIGSILPQLRTIFKNKDILNIIDLLYKSLKHEISSQLNQYYDYGKNGKKYDYLFDIIKDLNNFKVDNINEKFISELNQIRQHIYNSIKYQTTNKNYLKDLDEDIWNKPITSDNINEFIEDLRLLFKESADYIEKKIKLVDKILNEVVYDDYEGFLTESIYYIDKDLSIIRPVLFFLKERKDV